MARAAPALTRPSAGQQVSYEAFLEWADEDTWAEWVEGEVIVLSPASLLHQQLVRFLLTVLTEFVEHFGLGEVLTAPFQMKLGPAGRGSGREPDILFVATRHSDRLLENRLEGPADLVVEIVSPESLRRDRQDKFQEYQAAGVGEYWLLDYRRQSAEFYGLNVAGAYDLVPMGDDGIYRSNAVPGFWLREEWLWRRPLPKVRDILQELGIR